MTGLPDGPPWPAGSAVNAVAFSPDGTKLASADADGEVRLWQVGTGQRDGAPLSAGSAVTALAFSPGGTLAGAGVNGAVHLWPSLPGPPASRGADYWIILAGAAAAIALSVSAALVTTRGIWLAQAALGGG